MHPFLGSKLTTVALAGISLWLLVFAVAAGVRRHGSEAELGRIEERIDDSQRENERLGRELARMQEPEWLALLARQRLNYKMPDETVVFVYKSEKPGTIVQPQQLSGTERPRWRQWFEWLRGKEAGLPAEAP